MGSTLCLRAMSVFIPQIEFWSEKMLGMHILLTTVRSEECWLCSCVYFLSSIMSDVSSFKFQGRELIKVTYGLTLSLPFHWGSWGDTMLDTFQDVINNLHRSRTTGNGISKPVTLRLFWNQLCFLDLQIRHAITPLANSCLKGLGELSCFAALPALQADWEVRENGDTGSSSRFGFQWLVN